MKPSAIAPAGRKRFGDFGASVAVSVTLLLALDFGLRFAWVVIINVAELQNDRIVPNLRAIDQAKQRWAVEHREPSGKTPDPADLADLAPYFRNGKFPPSSIGESYLINPVGLQPTSTFPTRVKKGARTIEAGTVVTIPEK